MAGEHVKDAKQATGVRATVRTLRTYTNVKLCFFFFKKKGHCGKRNVTGIVTVLLQSLLILGVITSLHTILQK